jgi:hypothetical protein
VLPVATAHLRFVSATRATSMEPVRKYGFFIDSQGI